MKASKFSLKTPLPQKQIVITYNASENAAVHLNLVYKDKETGKNNKFAMVAFGYKRFYQRANVINKVCKKHSTMHLSFDEFGTITWGTKEPNIAMTNNKALTRFFKAKHVPIGLEIQ